MEREEMNKTNMLLTVDQFLDNNQPLISNNPVIVNAHTHLKADISRIQALSQKQAQDSTVETDIKNELKITLITVALRVAAGIGAHAATTNDLRLQAIANVSKTMLDEMRGEDFNVKIQAISDAATPIATQLAVWGVTSGDIDSLQSISAVFNTQSTAPRNVRVITSQATTELNQQVRDAVSYLKKNLDPIMLPFKTLNPTFHGEYINARKVIDLSATHKPGETPSA